MIQYRIKRYSSVSSSSSFQETSQTINGKTVGYQRKIDSFKKIWFPKDNKRNRKNNITKKIK